MSTCEGLRECLAHSRQLNKYQTLLLTGLGGNCFPAHPLGLWEEIHDTGCLRTLGEYHLKEYKFILKSRHSETCMVMHRRIISTDSEMIKCPGEVGWSGLSVLVCKLCWHRSEKAKSFSYLYAFRLTFDMKIRYPEVGNPGGGEWLDGQVYSIQSVRQTLQVKSSLKY